MGNANVVVRRRQFGQNYILGEVSVNGSLVGKTLEYPWRDNVRWDEDKPKGVSSLSHELHSRGRLLGDTSGRSHKPFRRRAVEAGTLRSNQSNCDTISCW